MIVFYNGFVTDGPGALASFRARQMHISIGCFVVGKQGAEGGAEDEPVLKTKMA